MSLITMITVLMHIRDNNTNSKEERATIFSTEGKRERDRETERETATETHREENRTAKDVAKKISSNRSKHDIHMRTRREVQSS